jgi:hypothetical protein
LYCADFVDRLNYANVFKVARKELVDALDRNGMCGHFYFDKWHLQGPFMLNPGHPQMFVMKDIALHLCATLGLPAREVDVEHLVVNRGRRGDIYPAYNHPRDQSLVSQRSVYSLALKALDLRQFIQHCYETIAKEGDQLLLPAPRLEGFKRALAAHQAALAAPKPTRVNPYAGLPPHRFWKNAVAEVATPRDVSPLNRALGVITPQSRVATAGSCFAQHISRTLLAQGLQYYVAETAPADMSEDEARTRHYGVFSARYGNVYTARQLLQLWQMAYGEFVPEESAWRDRDGAFVDPFRPNIGESFSSEAAVLESRRDHLAAVRRMFETLDVFVFTLGLTESWMRRSDGAVYPVAPGVVSQHANYAEYRFHNFTHDEVRGDLIEFLGRLFRVNPRARVILTVSPVPLIATYEDEHVLSATTYSKSVLRSVAQELAHAFRTVTYFPSFEIITGAYSKGAYFEDDQRNVRPAGVAHVMNVFMRTLVAGSEAAVPEIDDGDIDSRSELLREIKDSADVVCDENLIVSRP